MMWPAWRPFVLLCAAALVVWTPARVQTTAGAECARCPHIEQPHLHRPVPDADTVQLVGGPPAPLRQLGAVPPPMTVRLQNNSLLHMYMVQNIEYLLGSFDVDHMLFHFRLRAGVTPVPTGSRKQAWDSNLKGSNAGRFLMGAGNTLRWIEHHALRKMMDAVVDGIYDCRNKTNGYIMAFEPAGFMYSEQGDYGRSWVTQGLIEAGKAGNPRAFPMLRKFYDFFNDPQQNPYLPYLYDGVGNAEQGQIASTRMYLETPVGVYQDSQVAQDTYRDDLWLQQLIAKTPTGLSQYHMPSPNHPHCYEITAFLSMHDNWRATNNATWLAAAQGAYEIIVENFLNVDGSSALMEASRASGPNAPPNATNEYPPKSYPLGSTRTGETCCSMFWVKLCQRFQLMDPSAEKYTAEIEKTLYNALLRQLGQMENAPDGLSLTNSSYTGPAVRSFVTLQGSLETLRVPVATCCEGQGSRALGSLPEYVFSLNESAPEDGFWVNLFAPATLTLNSSVVEGVAPNPPPPPLAPQPTPTLPAAPTPVPLNWEQVATNSYFPTSYAGAGVGYWSVNASTLDECKQKCIDSGHPNRCQAITWFGSTAPGPPPQPLPPPPSPATCESHCHMTSTGHAYFNDGKFGDPVIMPSVAACNAVCLADPACIQVRHFNHHCWPDIDCEPATTTV